MDTGEVKGEGRIPCALYRALLCGPSASGFGHAACLTHCGLLSRLLLAPVCFLTKEDLKNCLETQALCQSMKHTLLSFPGTLLATSLVGRLVCVDMYSLLACCGGK